MLINNTNKPINKASVSVPFLLTITFVAERMYEKRHINDSIMRKMYMNFNTAYFFNFSLSSCGVFDSSQILTFLSCKMK